jgi:hypothetical protein
VYLPTGFIPSVNQPQPPNTTGKPCQPTIAQSIETGAEEEIGGELVQFFLG